MPPKKLAWLWQTILCPSSFRATGLRLLAANPEDFLRTAAAPAKQNSWPSKGHLSISSFSPDPLRSGKERVNSFCSFESVKHARPASRILESPGLAAADSCRQGSPSRKNREPEIGCCADGDSACVSVFVEGFVFWILGSCLAGRVFGFGAGARTCHSCENARVGRSRLLPSGNCTHRRPLAWNWAKRRPVSHRRSCLRRGSRPFWQRQLVRAAFDRAASHGRESPGGLAA